MGSPEMKVIVVCTITAVLVFLILVIFQILDRRRVLEANRIIREGGLVTTTMTNRTLDDVYGYEPSVAAAPSGNVSSGPSISVSASVSEGYSPSVSPSVSVSASPEPTGTESISPSGDYIDPYPTSSISYIPNPAVHHNRVEDEIIVRRDRNGRQYIVGRRRKEEDKTVFSPSPKDRPTRKLDE